MAKTMKKAEPQAYKSHEVGSRKGDVHRIFDEKGFDAAHEHGLSRGLKENTLSTWLRHWRKSEPSPFEQAQKAKAAAKAAEPKAKGKAAAPKAKGKGKPQPQANA